MPKPTKVMTKRKKFFEVDIPLINKKIELTGDTIEDLNNKTIKLDLTRQLRGKSVEANLKVKVENDSATAIPIKITLMPYFIRRMIRKRTSYIEDSIQTSTQESLIKVKPFLITRKKVSRAVRKTLRNQTKNWIEDYLKERKDNEVFQDILSNRLQKPLSLKLKKTYPLSLCEVRVFEIIRPLKQEEIPKKARSGEDASKKPLGVLDKEIKKLEEKAEKIEKKKIEKAEKEVKETQKKAEELEEKAEEKEKKSTSKKVKEPKTKKKTTKTEKK